MRMKTRVIQDEPDEAQPAAVTTDEQIASSGLKSWVKKHRLVTFFVLSYALAWWTWPLYGLRIWPEQTFFAVGPLLAALIVIAVAEGRPGFRDLGSRIIRWRVAWYWYAVAIGFPLAVRFLAAMVNVGPGGAPTPEWTDLAWTSFAIAFLVRLVNPMDGPLGEEPGWRGFALPRMQARNSPLISAMILGVLVAGWHLPLVFADDLGPIGLVSTFSITIFYVWLFNHARGSVLLTLIAHSAQGAMTMGDLGFVGADLSRQEWLECVAWSIVAIGVIVLDRAAWHKAPREAVYRDEG
jgi:membrane protease YdiL (CAAX protease family)